MAHDELNCCNVSRQHAPLGTLFPSSSQPNRFLRPGFHYSRRNNCPEEKKGHLLTCGSICKGNARGAAARPEGPLARPEGPPADPRGRPEGPPQMARQSHFLTKHKKHKKQIDMDIPLLKSMKLVSKKVVPEPNGCMQYGSIAILLLFIAHSARRTFSEE